MMVKIKKLSIRYIAICCAFIVLNCALQNDVVAAGESSKVKADKSITEVQRSRKIISGTALYINTNIVAETADSPANLMIINRETNESSMEIYIRAEDSNECVYESDIIPPGYAVDSARLQSRLKPGKHSCIAEFHVKADDGSDKAIVNVKVDITIKT